MAGRSQILQLERRYERSGRGSVLRREPEDGAEVEHALQNDGCGAGTQEAFGSVGVG